MTDPDLTALLRSPALALEPPPDLLADVRRGARRTRRRRSAGTVALSVLLVAGAAALAPGLVGEEGRRGPEQLAASPSTDPRFPRATTAVTVLERFNGGEVVTFMDGAQWCTGSARADRTYTCSRSVGAQVPPFAFLRGQGNESVTIDDDHVVAGLLGTGVDAVVLGLSDGSSVSASSRQPAGFSRPVWWHLLPRGVTVERFTAFDADGEVVAER